MRIYYKQLGEHIHMRVFFNGLAGTLVCGVDEFEEFQSFFSTTTGKIVWIKED